MEGAAGPAADRGAAVNGPVIALTSDFGRADPYVAEMKAVILAECARYPDASGSPTLVDVSHEVPPGDVAAAAWLLARTAPRFPAGTIHLAVVDPGVGTDRPAVAAAARGQVHVGPGNGLFRHLDTAGDLEVVRLDRPEYRLNGRAPSTTFHGRDIFAVAAAHLAMGVPPAQVGSSGTVIDLGPRPKPEAIPEGALGRVVWIDRFGNAITDIAHDTALGVRLSDGAVLRLGEGRAAGPLPTYGAARRDELFWYWGSGDTLELALRDAAAATEWNWRPGMVLYEELP